MVLRHTKKKRLDPACDVNKQGNTLIARYLDGCLHLDTSTEY